jgi:hypothetical protein
MQKLSKRTKIPARTDHGNNVKGLRSALDEATADRVQGRAALENLCPRGCVMKMLEVVLASVDRTARDKRKTSLRLLPKSAVVCSNRPILSGKRVGSRCRKLWLTFNKTAILAFLNGCVMLRQRRERLSLTDRKGTMQVQPTKL